MPAPEPRHAAADSEIERCFAVMAELRPHLQAGGFVATIRHMQTEGYRLAFIEQAGQVVAVAGYRISTNLLMGKNLYIDDLVTAAAARSQGHGEQLLAWLRQVARTEQCRALHLDSGTQRERAHKFYFHQGLSIASYHFSEPLSSP